MHLTVPSPLLHFKLLIASHNLYFYRLRRWNAKVHITEPADPLTTTLQLHTFELDFRRILLLLPGEDQHSSVTDCWFVTSEHYGVGVASDCDEAVASKYTQRSNTKSETQHRCPIKNNTSSEKFSVDVNQTIYHGDILSCPRRLKIFATQESLNPLVVGRQKIGVVWLGSRNIRA